MANDSPAVVIFGSDGFEVSVNNNITLQNSGNIKGLLIAGSDGIKSHHILTDNIGRLITTGNTSIVNSTGNSIILQDGSIVNNDGYGFGSIGTDGSNYHLIKTDIFGNQVVVGSGTAGNPSTGVLTIQGIIGGTPIPISGSITAQNQSVGLNNTVSPNYSTLIGGFDGYNLLPFRTDIYGNQVIVGLGIPGIPLGGVITVQGDPDSIPIPISGTIIAQNQSIGLNNIVSPTYSTLTGGFDGYNLIPFKTDNQGNKYNVITSPNALNNQYATVTSYNTLKTSQEASSLLFDKFDENTIDSIIWETFSNVNLQTIYLDNGLNIDIGLQSSTFSYIQSKNYFTQQANAFIIFNTSLQVENPRNINTHRFWGLGTSIDNNTTFPIKNGVGFEIDILGNLSAVVYSDTQKIFSQNLYVSDGYFHKYSFYWRNNIVYFFLDSDEYPVCTANLQNFIIQNLPIRIHTINNSTPSLYQSFIKIIDIGLSDTARNNISISDGRYQWQKLNIDANGAISLQESNIDGYVSPIKTLQIGGKDNSSKIRTVKMSLDGAEMFEVKDFDGNQILKEILLELKKMSFLLGQMSDIDLSRGMTE